MKNYLKISICGLFLIFISFSMFAQEANMQTKQISKSETGINGGIPMLKGGINYELKKKGNSLLFFVSSNEVDINNLTNCKVTIKEKNRPDQIFKNLENKSGFYLVDYNTNANAIVKLELEVNNIPQVIEWKL